MTQPDTPTPVISETSGADMTELREYLADPIVESECGSVENFIQNVIDWSDRINTLALRVRDQNKEANRTPLNERVIGEHYDHDGYCDNPTRGF